MKKLISLSSLLAIILSQSGCVGGGEEQPKQEQPKQEQDVSFPYATKEIKQELAQRLFNINTPIEDDFFETLNYMPIMQRMAQEGPSIFGEKEEQQVFWYYVMRLRILTLYFTFPRSVDDPGFLVEQLNFLGGHARQFIQEHPEEGQKIFASVIAYEEKYPYNPQKGIDLKRTEIKKKIEENLNNQNTDNKSTEPISSKGTVNEKITLTNNKTGEVIEISPEEFQNMTRDEFIKRFEVPQEEADKVTEEEFNQKKQALLNMFAGTEELAENLGQSLGNALQEIGEKLQENFGNSENTTEDINKQLQYELESLQDIPEKYSEVHQKILQAFKNDLEQMKSGLSPEEYAAKRKAELGIMEYELALTMHPLYPIEPFFSVLYLDQQEDQAAELPMQPDTGWTYRFPSHIRGQEGPLPCKLDMVYYSVVEHKCYSIQAPLPTDKLKELFTQKNADGDPLYTDITVGAAPFGKVVLWVQRNDTYEVQLVTQVQGEETEVSYEDFSRGFHTVGGNNWDEFHENILKQYPQAAENLAKNGLPDKNLFDQFNEKYNTKISVIFKEAPKEGISVNDVKISSVKISYFNGETENLPEGQNESRSRAKVKAIEIHFQDGQNENSSYLYVPYQTSLDNKNIQQVYNNIFGEDHNQPGQLTFTFNGPSKPWTVTLSAGEKQQEITMEEIRFRNKFEDYRTPVYYQPESQWKGSKPKDESPEIVINTATMNELNSNGETPLIDAVRSLKNDLVTKLLEAGADVNIVASSTGQTALSAASAMGHTDHVKQLIAAGANVNQPEGQSGMTPLMAASQSGNTEIVKLLIDAGADVNAKQFINGQDIGYNALKYARESGNEEIVQLLINNGAQEPIAQQQTASAPLTNTLDQALMAGNVEKVKEFLANGANPNTLIPGVGPALLFACTLGNAEIVQALVDAKADINSVSSTTGFTPLMMAVQMGNKQIVEILVKAGADVNIQHQMNGQPSGLNALKIAQNGGFNEIVELLKAAGAKE